MIQLILLTLPADLIYIKKSETMYSSRHKKQHTFSENEFKMNFQIECTIRCIEHTVQWIHADNDIYLNDTWKQMKRIEKNNNSDQKMLSAGLGTDAELIFFHINFF